MAVVPLSVCLCFLPDPKSRTEGRRKLKFGRKEVHSWYGWPVTTLEVEMSKVKVTMPITAVTENQPYLRNRNAYKLQTWYTDGVGLRWSTRGASRHPRALFPPTWKLWLAVQGTTCSGRGHFVDPTIAAQLIRIEIVIILRQDSEKLSFSTC